MTRFQDKTVVVTGGGGGIGGATCRRFGAEDGGYSEFALEVLRQPGGVAIEIFDDDMLQRVESLGVFREAMEAGEVLRADSAEELARLFGADPVALADELARYNRFVDAGGARGWGRRLLPRPPRPGSHHVSP